MQIIGHRGWRGQYPENSLIGFEALSNLGVNALELDVIITKDKEILVSHEAWFDLNYCTSKSESNLYNLTLAEIQKVDCGLKHYERFPNQKKLPTVKPSLKSVIELWNLLDVKPSIALEIKSEMHLYGSHQPFAQEFAELITEFEKLHLQGFDYFVQSFDPFFLKTYHQINPKQKTGLLIEHETNVLSMIDFLNYTPDFYNPEHILINDQIIKDTQSLNMGIYTWTVNEQAELAKIKDYPLLGIITDYPERFI
jgi:glycerophosphoryl diester phosphodiesterase